MCEKFLKRHEKYLKNKYKWLKNLHFTKKVREK